MAPKKVAKKAPAKKVAAKGRKKAAAPEAPKTLEGKFELQLQSVGLSGALELADKFEADYEVITTGFPGLNKLIGGAKIKHRSEEHTSELQSLRHLVCRLLLE